MRKQSGLGISYNDLLVYFQFKDLNAILRICHVLFNAARECDEDKVMPESKERPWIPTKGRFCRGEERKYQSRKRVEATFLAKMNGLDPITGVLERSDVPGVEQLQIFGYRLCQLQCYQGRIVKLVEVGVEADDNHEASRWKLC